MAKETQFPLSKGNESKEKMPKINVRQFHNSAGRFHLQHESSDFDQQQTEKEVNSVRLTKVPKTSRGLRQMENQ